MEKWAEHYMQTRHADERSGQTLGCSHIQEHMVPNHVTRNVLTLAYFGKAQNSLKTLKSLKRNLGQKIRFKMSPLRF